MCEEAFDGVLGKIHPKGGKSQWSTGQSHGRETPDTETASGSGVDTAEMARAGGLQPLTRGGRA